MRSLVCVEYVVDCQIFSALNAIWAFHIRAMMSAWCNVYFLLRLQFVIQTPPLPTKQAMVILIMVKSCSALLYILLVYINPLNTELNPIYHLLALLGAHHIIHISRIRVNSYLKSVVRHKILILDTFHQETLYLCVQGREDTLLFVKAKRGHGQKVWETLE